MMSIDSILLRQSVHYELSERSEFYWNLTPLKCLLACLQTPPRCKSSFVHRSSVLVSILKQLLNRTLHSPAAI